MNLFTIRDIESLSGIKAHTWRIWEQRYGIGIAQRKDSNHRFFDNDNLKNVLRIAYLYHSGVKISKIASLAADEIKNVATPKMPQENVGEFYIKELMEASIDLDEERFEFAFNEAIKRMGMQDAMVKIVYAFQERIGALWLTDHVVPAQEHFTSNIISRKLAVAIDQLPYIRKTEKKEIVLFTPENEQHEIPLQFIHYLLRKNGNKVIYFGSDVALNDIERGIQKNSFTCLWFHFVTNLTSFNNDEYLKDISSRFADKQIIMSGPQVKKVTEIPGNVRLLQSMNEIVEVSGK